MTTLAPITLGLGLVWLATGGLYLPAASAAEAGRASGEAARSEAKGRKYFSDVVLVNQAGQPMRFYTDLLKEKVVVISSFFSTCTGVCPMVNHKLAQIQQALGDRMGRDVYLISLSVDPETDTPARIKEYARSLNAGPGWYFLTGKKENVDWALYRLGLYVENKDNHSTLLIIGNESKGVWRKALAYDPTEALIQIIEDALKK